MWSPAASFTRWRSRIMHNFSFVFLSGCLCPSVELLSSSCRVCGFELFSKFGTGFRCYLHTEDPRKVSDGWKKKTEARWRWSTEERTIFLALKDDCDARMGLIWRRRRGEAEEQENEERNLCKDCVTHYCERVSISIIFSFKLFRSCL